VSWWNNYKPVSLVELKHGQLGLRMTTASGERMTMPLARATFKMLLPPGLKLR
jgi:hypothetical protein